MLFQFHKVRLKAMAETEDALLRKFQFHKVRLKEGSERCAEPDGCVSIP